MAKSKKKKKPPPEYDTSQLPPGPESAASENQAPKPGAPEGVLHSVEKLTAEIVELKAGRLDLIEQVESLQEVAQNRAEQIEQLKARLGQERAAAADPDRAKAPPAARIPKRFAVMAHPRSGTVYMSRLFQAFGCDVGDENRMGADGISSFLIGAVENPRWGPDPWAYEFEHRIHLVRHPLQVVSSVLACVTEEVQAYMARVVGVKPSLSAPRRVIMVYLAWNKRIELQKPTARIRVEDAPAELRKLLNVDPNPDTLPPTDINKREDHLGGCRPPNFDIKYFQRECPPAMLYEFMDAMREYGYANTL